MEAIKKENDGKMYVFVSLFVCMLTSSEECQTIIETYCYLHKSSNSSISGDKNNSQSDC